MSITIQCEKCGATYTVPEDRAGEVEQCRCGNSIPVLIPQERAEGAARSPALNPVFAVLILMLGVWVTSSCVLTPCPFLGARMGRMTDLASVAVWLSHTISGVLMIVCARGLFRLRPWAWWVAVVSLGGLAVSNVSGLLGGPAPFVIAIHLPGESYYSWQAVQISSLLAQASALFYYLRARRHFAERHVSEIKPLLALMSLAPLIVGLCIHRPIVSPVTFSPDGKTLAASMVHRSPLMGMGRSGGQVLLWNTETGRLQCRAGIGGWPVGLMFSPDGRALAVGIMTRSFPIPVEDVTVWNAETAKPKFALQGGHWPIAFSPDGRTLAGIHDRGIGLWDAASGKIKWDLSIPTGLSSYPAWSLDCRTVAFSTTEKLAAGLGERQRYSHHIEVWDAQKGKLRATLPKRPGFATPIAVSPDGTALAVTQGSGQGLEVEVALWDIPAAQLRRTLTDKNLHKGSVCFSPDSRALLYEGPLWTSPLNVSFGSLGRTSFSQPLWDTDTGRLKWRREATGRGCAFSPDGRTIAFVNGFQTRLARALGASQSNGSREQVCDTETGRAMWTASGHSGIGVGIAFSPDGSKVASWAADGKVRLFDARTGQLLRTL